MVRLWDISEFFWLLYAYEADSQRQIVAEHRGILVAVQAKDHERLVAHATSIVTGPKRRCLPDWTC